MESVDRKILDLLSREGRTSYTDLGRALGMSTSTVHQRVRRLEERGIITGYRAEIDYAQADAPLTALISLSPFDPSAPDDIPDRIAHLPQIASCWSVAGEESYVILVRVATPHELEGLLADIRAAGSCSTHTTVVLSTPWENRPVTPSAAD